MSLDRTQVKLYLYQHTREFEGDTEDEIKYQVIKQFLLADDREFDAKPNQPKVSLGDGSVYQQILSVVDQPLDNDYYDDYSDFEYAMVKRILMFVPSDPSSRNNPQQLAITTTFTNKIKSKSPKLGSLFQSLFNTLSENARGGMVILLTLIVLGSISTALNYYRENITAGTVYTVVKTTATIAYQGSRYILTSTIINEEYLLPIEYIANNIITTAETGVINIAYLIEQLDWLRGQLYLQLVNNPIVPAVTYLLESRVSEVVPDQVLNQMVEQAPVDTIHRLLYWLRVFNS